MNTSGQSDGEEAARRLHLLRRCALLLRRHIEAEKAFKITLQDLVFELDGTGSYQLDLERAQAFFESIRGQSPIVVPDGYGIEFVPGRRVEVIQSAKHARLLGDVPPGYFREQICIPPTVWTID